MTSTRAQTVTVPGRAGWQGQQGSTVALALLGVILGIVIAAAAVIWISDPAPAIRALGITALAALVVSVWLLVAHLRVGRVRVVRATAVGDHVVFSGAREVTLPTRLFAVVGVAMLAAWGGALFTAPAESLPIVTLLGVPVVAVALTYGGIRAWLPGAGSHSLTLTPQRMTLRIPRNALDVEWNEVESAQLTANRVHVVARGRGNASFAARDLASDPVIVAELISFYARTPRARAQIGPETLRLLAHGDF